MESYRSCRSTLAPVILPPPRLGVPVGSLSYFKSPLLGGGSCADRTGRKQAFSQGDLSSRCCQMTEMERPGAAQQLPLGREGARGLGSSFLFLAAAPLGRRSSLLSQPLLASRCRSFSTAPLFSLQLLTLLSRADSFRLLSLRTPLFSPRSCPALDEAWRRGGALLLASPHQQDC